jgi:DNA-binding LacI/PurR family transcriptional regulator
MTPGEKKILIAAPSFLSSFHTAVYEHLKKWFKADEVLLRSVTDEADQQKQHLEQALIKSAPRAVIAISVRPDSQTISAYQSAGVPIILIDESTAGVSTISTDNWAGGRLAGEYLASKGRQRIAVITGRTQIKGGYNADQRLQGLRQALAAKGLTVPDGCAIEVPHYSRDDGVAAMPKLLDRKVDAIFCAAGDICATGILAVARERRVRVPDDVAVVGYDDLIVAQISTPTLTTIKQPLAKIAEAAYKLTRAGPEELLRKPQTLVFPPELVLRRSA